MVIQQSVRTVVRAFRPAMATKLAALALSAVLVLGLIPASLQTAKAQSVGSYCFIDLVANTFDNQTGGAISFLSGPAGGQAVVKITLNPNVNDYSRAVFRVHYASAPTNWTLNIGDSATNDGGGGDAGTQSNDAEMQIFGDTLSVFANDNILPASKLLLTRPTVVASGETITLEVKDNYMGWGPGNPPQQHVRSQFLYALNGQPDTQGPINYDIYAGFNRTIGDSTRNGNGASWVLIQLLP